ncbi:MAG TPA: ATP-binding protein [Candidatus Thermoplasmatota archaeon]|nr:ATP-binding protein [Candidatus Thermoplasmatota archaeon]
MRSIRGRAAKQGPGPSPTPRAVHPVAIAAGVAVAYYALARVGLLFSLPGVLASPIWPPTGLAIAAVALWRGPAAAGVFAGAFMAEWAASGSPVAAAGLGLGNTLEASVGGLLLARMGGLEAFRRVAGVARFVLACVAAPLASVGFGLATLVALGRLSLATAPPIAWTWYLGDLAGALVIAPAVLLAAQSVGASMAKARRGMARAGARDPFAPVRALPLETLAAASVLLAMAAFIFGLVPGVPADWPAPVILLMPALVWVGYRLPPAVAATAMVALDALAIAATRAGHGPFRTDTANESFLHLQAFVLTVAAMVLTLGAWATERRRSEAQLEVMVADRTARLQAEVEDRRGAEDALKAANQALADAQRLAKLGSWALDGERQTVTASPVMFHLAGLEPRTGPVPLGDMQAHMDQEDVAASEVLIAAALALGMPASYDVHVRAPGMPPRILHVEGQVAAPGSKTLVGTAQDVTRQREAEAALRASHAALAEAQRIAGIGSWELDPARQQVMLSQEMARLLGVPHQLDWVPSLVLLERIDPAHVRPAQEALARCVRDRAPLSFDLRLRPVGSAGGLWLHMEGRLDGRTGHLAGTGQDVTSDHEAEEALRESLERFRVLAEASPLGIFHTTLQGQVDYANPRWSEISGCDPNDFAAIRAAVHPDDVDRLTAEWRKAVGSGTDLVSEFRYVHKDGKAVECVTRASPVRDASGAVTGFVGTVEDATGRHRLEARQREMDRLREQARFKTEFLRTAAHELGNPLTPIRIQLRILKDTVGATGTEGARRSVAILDRNVERLGLLVRDMLESARLQGGRMRLIPQGMDLSHVVHDVIETFQGSAIEAGVAMDLEAPPRLPMVGDPDRLTQVLYNLLSNGMKFTPAGGRIHVRVEALQDADAAAGHVRVTVSDTGAGFTPDQAGGLFQPFGQVHDAVPGKGGTGLGLYISKGIVEQHGGTLAAHSDGPGRGSTFTVLLPLVAAAQPKEEPFPLPPVPPTSSGPLMPRMPATRPAPV